MSLMLLKPPLQLVRSTAGPWECKCGAILRGTWEGLELRDAAWILLPALGYTVWGWSSGWFYNNGSDVYGDSGLMCLLLVPVAHWRGSAKILIEEIPESEWYGSAPKEAR